jgi:hypothetical protein
MAFSATDAAFEGFRVVRRNPMALVFWALFYMVLIAAAFALMGGSFLSLTSAAEQLEQAGGTPTPEEFMPVLAAYAALIAVIVPLSLIASAVLYAAVSRAVLRPEEKSFGSMRLGMDEVRVLVVSLVLALLFMLLAVVAFGVIGAVAGFATAGDAPALWIVVLVLGLAACGLFIWLAVRLSLAIPITMAERRIAVFESFGVTKGRFWPLLGMALLAVVMSMVVGLLGTLVFLPLRLVAGDLEGLAGLEGETMASIVQVAWPAIAAWIVINAVMSALQVAVVYAPFSAAYRDIQGQKPDSAVFD